MPRIDTKTREQKNAPEPAAGRPLSLSTHARETLGLAGPSIISRSGILLMITADTLMAGWQGTRELALMGLAMPVQAVLMMGSIGLMQGQLILTAQAFGAGQYQRCGLIWRIGMAHAALLGLLLVVLTILSPGALLTAGQNPDLVRETTPVLIQFAWGMPGMLFYLACGYFLEGLQRPHIAMIAMIGANLLNIGLNYLTMTGLFGPQGAEGVVFATSIVRWILFAGMLAYILTMADRRAFGIGRSFRDVLSRKGAIVGKQLRRLGLPIAFAFILEAASLAALTLMAGRLGAPVLAAFHITMQIVQILYMISIGTAAATAVRVGAAAGRRDGVNLRLAGWTGVGVIGVLMGVCFVGVVTQPELLARAFVTGRSEADTAVLALAAATIAAAGVMIISNGVMSVLMGALRGMGDVWRPLGRQAAGLWLVGIPSAWWLAFGQDLGPVGLAYGAFLGMTAAAVLLAWRFHAVSSAAARPIQAA